ncbi:MAG TPA: tyrosinase family protein [Steroidobacteraceae bacterium]|nr:tyrosinase family protein [Steroidobacteraceae bacterium]
MRQSRPTRREFLGYIPAVVSGTFFATIGFAPRRAVAAPSYVRRDVGNMSPTDPILVSYADAVVKMQALNNTNPLSPLSWNYQAAIHGTLMSGSMPAWNSCQHGSYFFWSWHRMYLYWFERIVRTLANDSCWALPYWNYCSPNESTIPAAFLDTTSALFHPRFLNNGASLTGSATVCNTAVQVPNFIADSGFTEGTPHGAVHVQVGGDMGSVPTAALDPIFYLHHANIDRLWDLYLAQSPGASDPLNDAAWTTTQFTFFNENGFQVLMSGCDVLRAQQQLGYSYEGEPAQINEFCSAQPAPKFRWLREILLRIPLRSLTLSSEVTSVPVDIAELRDKLGRLAESKTENLLLELEEVEAERSPQIIWEVYLGAPARPAPVFPSPFFIGNVALFGVGIRSERHHEFKPANFAFNIKRAVLAALVRRQKDLVLTFKPVVPTVAGKAAQPIAASPVHIGRVSITVERRESQN